MIQSRSAYLCLGKEAPSEERQLESEVKRDPVEEDRHKRLQDAERRKHNPVRQPAKNNTGKKISLPSVRVRVT